MTSLGTGMTKPGGWFAELFWPWAPTAQGTASAVIDNETKNLRQNHEQGLWRAKDNRAGDRFGIGSNKPQLFFMPLILQPDSTRSPSLHCKRSKFAHRARIPSNPNSICCLSLRFQTGICETRKSGDCIFLSYIFL
jgi:hypothetical protein